MPKEIFEAGLVIRTSRSDPEEVPRHTHGWKIDINEMTKQPFEVDIRAVHTSHLQLSLMRYHTAAMIDGGYPEGTVIFSSIGTEGLIHEKNRRYATHDLIVLDDRKPFDLVVSSPCSIYTIAIEREILEREFESFFKQPFARVYREEDIYLEPAQCEAFRTLFREQMEQLEVFSEREVSGEEYAAMEIEILKTLFSSFLFRPKRISYLPRYIREGRTLLEEHIGAPYTIADLAEELGISQRTLQHGFKHYLGFTPKEYQQYIRLNAIRKTILNVKDPAATLSGIAAKYNYSHSGHFSAEYKKFFGESPSETLRRVQGR